VCAVLPGPLAIGANVLHAHHYRVCDLAGARWTAIVPDVTDDYGTIAETEL
jgi:hypothetical protein